MLLRIGLALGAGLLIAIVPIALRKGRFEPHLSKRIFLFALAAASAIGFVFYVWMLWNQHVPRKSPAAAPLTYPALPPGP